MQHSFQLLISPISSKLTRITHLFITIDHLNPSAAFDNSYRGLVFENLTRRVQDRQTGRQAGTVGAQLPVGMRAMFFPSSCFMGLCADNVLRHGRAGKVGKLRWSLGRDMKGEVCVCVYICLVNGSGKPLSTVQVNH